jgi:hypothetical protein
LHILYHLYRPKCPVKRQNRVAWREPHFSIGAKPELDFKLSPTLAWSEADG